MEIINKLKNKIIETDINYEPEKLKLKVIPGEYEGIYNLNYVSTLEDSLLGLIEGKICKFNFEVPKCLSQCYICIELGTPTEHECLDRCYQFLLFLLK